MATRCAAAETACLEDENCAAIVNAVVDPVYPTPTDVAYCLTNTLCAASRCCFTVKVILKMMVLC